MQGNRRMRIWGSAVLLACAAMGCTKPSGAAGQLPDDAKGTVEVVLRGVAEGEPSVAWSALPSRYQRDITKLVHDIGAKVDADLYDEMFDLARRLANVLKTKKRFLLGHPAVASEVDPAAVRDGWDAVVGMLEVLVHSDLASAAKLRTIDIGAFLAGDGARFLRHFVKASSLSDDGGIQRLSQAVVEQVGQSGEVVTLRVAIPGQPAKTLAMKQVDGRWLPAEMVDGWDHAMAQAAKQVAEMGNADRQASMPAKMVMGMAGAMLSQLEEAETQEEFNEVVNGILSMGLGGPAAQPGR